MFAAMAVGLYASRVLLRTLGHEEFGVLFLIASILATIGFLQASLTGATQRFIAFELGKSKNTKLSEIFTTCLALNCIISTIILLTAETVGIWVLQEYVNVPPTMLNAATMSFHLATAAIIITSLYSPLSAVILAHERMGAYATLGVVDVTLKLFAALAIDFFDKEQLITYSALLTAIAIIIGILHIWYFKRHFPEITITKPTIATQTKNIIRFASWSIWGNLASTLSTQGSNVLISAFFGPTISASRTVSLQANNAINNFIQNIQAAINPTIIKLYAGGNSEKMHELVCTSARLNYLFLMTLAIPTIIYSHEIMSLWLTSPPILAANFLQLLIINSLIESLSNPLMTAAHASGKLRTYQITIGTIVLLNTPITYLLFDFGNGPQAAFITSISLSIAALAARLIIVRQLINMKISSFIRTVVYQTTSTTGVSLIGAFLILLAHKNEAVSLAESIGLTLVLTTITTWITGLNKAEKSYLLSKLKRVK
jgi:O-antigen/teichoic acid export membrane protein